MTTTTTTGTAAAQEAAAPTAQTVATATTSTETGDTATVATPLFRATKKQPPRKRLPAAEKAPKEAKRITGVLVHIALVSYNHWRLFVNEIINGEDKDAAKLARFVKDETALPNTKWGGFIGVSPEHKDKVLAILNAWTAENNAKPVAEQAIDLWSVMEHFQTVEPKPRVRKTKAEKEAEKAAASATEGTTTEATAEVTDATASTEAIAETTETSTEVVA
jgi:hypothetical protein